MNARGYRPLIAHVEAGLRSFDRTMPEEINRLLTDQISDFLFTPSPDANENLKKEGIPEEKIFLVGNVMVDSLLFNLEIPNYRCLALTLWIGLSFLRNFDIHLCFKKGILEIKEG